MSKGHSTSAVPRPRDSAPGGRPTERPVDRTRSDQTRFGARVLDDDLQIATRRTQRWLIAVVAVAVFAALVAALFVLPVQAWLRQEDEIVAKRQELEVLSEANRKLGVEVDHLATPEGAKEAARDELGVVGPGEERISVLPGQTGPLPLPAGWPYDTINQIVAVRAAAPTAP